MMVMMTLKSGFVAVRVGRELPECVCVLREDRLIGSDIGFVRFISRSVVDA